MDASKCLQILHTRNITADPEKAEIYKSSVQALVNNEVHAEISQCDTEKPSGCSSTEILTSMTAIDLMNMFTTLQGERVRVYSDFDAALQILLNDNRLVEYPILCAEVTSRFSVLSKKVINVKDTFDQRKMGCISNIISAIQLLEKSKLMLVASQHLDIMNLSGESVQLNMGNLTLSSSKTNSSYSLEKINEIKNEISEHLENFQSLKCDYLED